MKRSATAMAAPPPPAAAAAPSLPPRRSAVGLAPPAPAVSAARLLARQQAAVQAPGAGAGLEEDMEIPEAGKAVVGVGAPAPTNTTDIVRGLARRDYITWVLFRALARGDFHHDFGENQPTRDKITAADENRFFEIAKLVTTKGNVWIRTNFKEKIGKNLYTLIGDRINQILPKELPPTPLPDAVADARTAGVDPAKFAAEDDLLKFLGLNWVALKGEIVNLADGAVIKKTFATDAVPPGREYQIRACPYRVSPKRGTPGYDKNRAPIESLRIVTDKKTSFACIIDASGGFPFSDLRNRELMQEDNAGSTVYIIENIENGADSATKILPPPVLPKGKVVEGFKTPPALRILRDKESTVNYPLWAANSIDPKSNIYSTLHIVLNRVTDDTVEANLLVRGAGGVTTESYSIGDVSNMSNVKNATLYALAKILEKGITNDALVYTLIKRMGDWCQALSLLDLDRVYTVSDPDGKVGPTQTTLRQLQADGTEVGIVTNDRILLAFCILLGLNVFYTSAMDIGRLLYFKNTLDVASPEALEKRVADTLAGVPPSMVGTSARITKQIDRIQSTQAEFVAKQLATPSLPSYIFNLRNLLSNFARLRLDLRSLEGQAAAQRAIATNPAIPALERLNAANALVSLLAKIDLDLAYNTSVLTDIANGVYPNSKTEKIRLDELNTRLASGGRIAKSVGVMEAKEIIRELGNDIRQLKGKAIPLLAALPPFRTSVTEFGADPKSIDPKEVNNVINYTEILSVFPAILILLPPAMIGGQRGGSAAENIDRATAALSTRKVLLLPSDVDEVTSTQTIYKRGDTYYDKSLRGYTVVNEYIITKQDLPAFELAFSEKVPLAEPVAADTAEKLAAIQTRYSLLQIDMALNDLLALEEDMTSRAEDIDRLEPLGSGIPVMARLVNLKATFEETFGPAPPSEAKDRFGEWKALKDLLLTTRAAIIEAIPIDPVVSEESAEAAAAERELGRLQTLVLQDIPLVDGFLQRNSTLFAPALGPKEFASLGAIIRAAIMGGVLAAIDPAMMIDLRGVLTITDILTMVRTPDVVISRAIVRWTNDHPTKLVGDEEALRMLITLHIGNVMKGLDVPPPERRAAVEAQQALAQGSTRRERSRLFGGRQKRKTPQ